MCNLERKKKRERERGRKKGKDCSLRVDGSLAPQGVGINAAKLDSILRTPFIRLPSIGSFLI